MEQQVQFDETYFDLKKGIASTLYIGGCTEYEYARHPGWAIFPAEKGTVARVQYRFIQSDHTNPRITQAMRDERATNALRKYRKVLEEYAFTVEGPYADLDIPYLVVWE